MKRKKFVKILMACGVDRNSAVNAALTYNRLNISYEDALGLYSGAAIKVLEVLVDRIVNRMLNAVTALGDQIMKAKETIMDNTERFVAVTHAMKVRDSLRYCAGVFDGEECNACDYEGCTTELMLDAAHSIDRLLEVIHGLAEDAGK